MKIKRFALGPLWTNGYVVFDTSGNALLIDPAAESQTILKWMKENDLKLQAVLLTHGHIDHIAGLSEAGLADLVENRIYVHSADSQMLTHPEKEFAHRLGFEFDGVNSVENIKDGDILRFGSLNVKVIGTPGHTRGSVCFLIDNALFSGDTLFAGSVGRTDLEGGDEKQLEVSLLILKELSPDIEVYPGHGPSTTLFDEASRNPFWPSK